MSQTVVCICYFVTFRVLAVYKTLLSFFVLLALDNNTHLLICICVKHLDGKEFWKIII